MWDNILFIMLGIYIGTYYNCKPWMDKICESVANKIPEKRAYETNPN